MKEKSDLESRLEEEQDEVEQLVTKQRHHISQISGLQQQLTDANFLVEELQESKHSLENKVIRHYCSTIVSECMRTVHVDNSTGAES